MIRRMSHRLSQDSRSNSISSVILVLGMLIAVLVPLLVSTPAIADDGKDSQQRSIQHDWVSKTLDSHLSSGGSILPGGPTSEDREQWALDTLKDPDGSAQRSLYDRFGDAPFFQEYYGEVVIPVALQDNIYTNFVENKEFKISVDELKRMLTESGLSNNSAYQGRPEVLTMDAYNNGYYDPRVERYSPVTFSAGITQFHKINLNFAKFFVEVTGFFLSPAIIETVYTVWTTAINSGLWESISSLGGFLFAVGLLVMIGSIIAIAFNFVKGRGGIRDALDKVITVSISLIIIGAVSATPQTVGDVFYNALTKVDQEASAALNNISTEAVSSDDPRNAMTAAIWERVVLDPVCYGELGVEYRNSYTMYSGADGIPESQQYKQTAQDISTGTEDQYVMNSKEAIGDHWVALGGGTKVRNWCAIIVSTQSKYHLPADQEQFDRVQETWVDADKAIWPVADVMPNNNQIYGDSFTWIDASMDIGYVYNDAGYIKSFDLSRPYKNYFFQGSLLATIRYLALIPLLILGIKKTWSSIEVVITGGRMFYFAVMSLFGREYSSWGRNFKKIFKSMYYYIWYLVSITIGVIAYSRTMENGVVGFLLWILIAAVLLKMTPITDIQKTAQSTKRMARATMSRARRR